MAPKARTPKLPPVPEAEVQATAVRWRIWIPGWRPTTLNELMKVHWAKASRMKAADRNVVALYARKCEVPKATGKRRVSLRITLPKGQKRWDRDNVWKSLLDSCVKCGLLKNDSPDWLEPGEIEYVRGGEYETEILIEDVA